MSVLPAAEKVATLRRYAAEHGLRTMVETGVYMGSCSGVQMLDALDNLIVIDYQLENVEKVAAVGPKVIGLHGDSGAMLERWAAGAYMPETRNGPALFWLDAHAIDASENAPPCPLRFELETITRWAHGADSVVLIDDLRLMQPDTIYVRELGWPTLGELRGLVDGFWRREEGDDIMRLTPRKGAPVSDDKSEKGKPQQTDSKTSAHESENEEQQQNPELYAEMQARGLRDPD